MKIVFPEGNNPIIKSATARAKQDNLCEVILLDGSPEALPQAFELVKTNQADGVIAGIDYTSRDVILSSRDILGVKPGVKTFSSVFFMEMPNGKTYALSDCATCKHPTVDQLVDIIEATTESASKILGDIKIAVLSFSTFGSGGRDETIDIAREAIAKVKERHPHLVIDGEMQLDAAVNPRIGEKKAPDSPITGQANVLICPDINAGNILCKSMQQFGGGKAYGPILQGFNHPVSDLSRGSTEDDVYGIIKILTQL